MSGNEISLPPLRSLNDFLLGSARFQVPNYGDVDRWGNRVVNNILYYQTNYFVLTLLAFLCVGFFHPAKMVIGSSSISTAFLLYRYLTSNRRAAEFKRRYPWVGVTVISVGGYLIVYFLDSVLVFVFGILLPICLVFIHSSLRLRSVKNKISNKIEMIGLRRSPMGKFLELFVLRARMQAEEGLPPQIYKKSFVH